MAKHRSISPIVWVAGACLTVVAVCVLFQFYRSCFVVRENFDTVPIVPGTAKLSFEPEYGSANGVFSESVARSKPGLYSPDGQYVGQTVTKTAGQTYRGEWIQARVPAGTTTITFASKDEDLFKDVALLGSNDGNTFTPVNVRGFPPVPNKTQAWNVERKWPFYRLVLLSTHPKRTGVQNMTTAFFNDIRLENRLESKSSPVTTAAAVLDRTAVTKSVTDMEAQLATVTSQLATLKSQLSAA